MTELHIHIVHRAEEALASLEIAEAKHDVHLVTVCTGELESLARTAAAHDLDVPALRDYAPRVA